MDDYLEFAKKLAYQAGAIIRDNFGAKYDVELKSDHSPVTQIDRQINELVIKRIKSNYSDHGVIGEEASDTTGKEKYQWLCDPLDGTSSYVLAMPHSTFIIGLLEESNLVMSIVYDPFNGNLYHAIKGKGAFCNGKLIQVNQQPLTDGYVLVEPGTANLYKTLESHGALLEPVSGAGYRCIMLATGRGVASPKLGADRHDLGVGALLVEEAGGKVTDFTGQPIKLEGSIESIILSNGVAHQQMLEITKNSSDYRQHNMTL